MFNWVTKDHVSSLKLSYLKEVSTYSVKCQKCVRAMRQAGNTLENVITWYF